VIRIYINIADEQRLLKLIPARHRKQASTLLNQFNKRGNELTWNSDGVILIDQTSIPNSDIYLLFPYLFKMKHPKNLTGFEDFQKKIYEMGLDHLIVKRYKPVKENKKTSNEPLNWWYLD
jgi:hypothetical protein